jgi:hypothetical protein
MDRDRERQPGKSSILHRVVQKQGLIIEYYREEYRTETRLHAACVRMV